MLAASRLARIALAWVLHRPFVMSVIIGAKTIEQLGRQSGRDRGQAHR